MKTMRVLIVCLVLVAAFSACARTSCPSKETVKAAVTKIMPVSFEVAEIRGMNEIPGICEVIVVVSKQPVIFYTDPKGKYVISGSIVAVENKQNITLERQQSFKK